MSVSMSVICQCVSWEGGREGETETEAETRSSSLSLSLFLSPPAIDTLHASQGGDKDGSSSSCCAGQLPLALDFYTVLFILLYTYTWC